jgi:hypothetical protein
MSAVSTRPVSGLRAADPRRWRALVVLVVLQFMLILDATVVNVALPSIKADLGLSSSNVAWVIDAYVLVAGGFLLLGGRYQGRDAIATFLRRFPLAPDRRFRLLPTSANGQPALAAYIWDEQTSSFETESILVLTPRRQYRGDHRLPHPRAVLALRPARATANVSQVNTPTPHAPSPASETDSSIREQITISRRTP